MAVCLAAPRFIVEGMVMAIGCIESKVNGFR
jgi:hypothetical protein